jgi:hypothetical protein
VTDRHSGLKGRLKEGRKGVGNGRLSTGLDPQCPLEYIDSVYIGTTLTDGRFIGQSPSAAWPSYDSLRLIKDENGINKQTNKLEYTHSNKKGGVSPPDLKT